MPLHDISLTKLDAGSNIRMTVSKSKPWPKWWRISYSDRVHHR